MPREPESNPLPGPEDRRIVRRLVVAHLLLFAYFFQGGGWNQNARFDTVRALVERGTFEITAYAANTGDVAVVDGRVYSNKSPGQALLAAPVYAVAFAIEKAIGLDPGAPFVTTANAHLLTVATSGLPAALLVALLFVHFRRRGATRRDAGLLASAFGTGSLLLPYAGVLMNHLLAACLLFASWLLLFDDGERAGAGRRLAGGLCAGVAVLVEPIAAPAAGLFVLVLIVRKRRHAWPVLIGPLACALLLAGHNLASFGSVLASGYTASDRFKSPDLFLGVLGWPDPRRFLWLTVHPYRGLFWIAPVLLVPLLGVRRPRMWRPSAGEITAGFAIFSLLLFNLSFNGWTGGWAVGPRYLIPATPFLWAFALRGFRRFRRASGVLMALSTAIVLAVTAVRVMVPAPNGGDPIPLDPVRLSLGELAHGRVSTSSQSVLERRPHRAPENAWDSYNLGELVGLRGAWSLLPALILVAGCWLAPQTPSKRGIAAEGDSRPAASPGDPED